MLIITRRPKQKIILGDNITIHVMEVSGNNVRLGIEAPDAVPIYREEIWAAVKSENEAAATTTPEKMPRAADSVKG